MKLTLRAVRSLVLLSGLAALAAAGLALASSTEAQAARCCWVYVCDGSGCYHKCVTCPKFP